MSLIPLITDDLKAANSRHIWWISLRLVAWFIGRPLMELKNPAVFNKWIMRWKLIAIKKWTLMHEQSQWRSHWHCNMQICVQLWLTIIRALHVNLESYSDFATHGLAEGCRSLLKLLSLWQIRTKISFPANDITQFIIVWGCAWILIEKTLNGPAYGNTCRCSESILCCPVITLLKRWVCETTNCGRTIMEPGSKPSPKTKPLIERLLMARRVHAESEFSMKEAGGSLIYFSPSSVVLLSRFRECFCVRMWHGARIDL